MATWKDYDLDNPSTWLPMPAPELILHGSRR